MLPQPIGGYGGSLQAVDSYVAEAAGSIERNSISQNETVVVVVVEDSCLLVKQTLKEGRCSPS